MLTFLSKLDFRAHKYRVTGTQPHSLCALSAFTAYGLSWRSRTIAHSSKIPSGLRVPALCLRMFVLSSEPRTSPRDQRLLLAV